MNSPPNSPTEDQLNGSAAEDCDLDLTLELFDLFKTPQDQRDQDWIDDFLDVVPRASLVAMEPQIQRGPDGFPYLAVSLPKPDEDFDAISVSHAIPHCLKQGCGIVLFADAEKPEHPEWIFPYGTLWAYSKFENFYGDPEDDPRTLNEGTEKDAAEKPTDEKEREVLVASPNEEFLPTFARTAIGRFLKQAIGLKTPVVTMVTDPVNKPPRCLMFTDLLPERFEKEEDFGRVMSALRWFLPPTRGLMVAVPQLAQYAQPL